MGYSILIAKEPELLFFLLFFFFNSFFFFPFFLRDNINVDNDACPDSGRLLLRLVVGVSTNVLRRVRRKRMRTWNHQTVMLIHERWRNGCKDQRCNDNREWEDANPQRTAQIKRAAFEIFS